MGKKNTVLLRQGDTCQQDDKVTLITRLGNKCIGGNGVQYTSPMNQNDNVTMIIDMRPYKSEVSFAKNWVPLGIAYSGF